MFLSYIHSSLQQSLMPKMNCVELADGHSGLGIIRWNLKQ